MKVYSGGQYGNNFNSGDEGLFQDANRPRDNDKFKIRPGVQTEKLDFRQANKDIVTKASELIVEATIISSSGTTYKYPPELKQKEKVGDPGCVISADGKIEIVEDGTYIIQASCKFKFSSTPSDGQNYIEDVALLKRVDEAWVIQAKSQGRACANTSNHYDQLSALYTGWITKGTILTVGACHTYSSSITLQESMSIQRLA